VKWTETSVFLSRVRTTALAWTEVMVSDATVFLDTLVNYANYTIFVLIILIGLQNIFYFKISKSNTTKYFLKQKKLFICYSCGLINIEFQVLCVNGTFLFAMRPAQKNV